MKKLLIVVDAPGPAEFIDPIIPLLKKSAKLKLVTVKDSPTKLLEKYSPARCDSESGAESIYKKFNPDVLLVATSSLVLGPFINNRLTELAHAEGKKIICFQDYWANHRYPMNFKMMGYWNSLLTVDELAKNFVLQDGYKGKVMVTGNPAFDKFRDLNVATERARLRKNLNIPDDAFVILHSGTGTPQSFKEDEITFKFLANAVREFKKDYPNLVFISRPHPRDENPGRYQTLAPDLDLLNTSDVAMTENLMSVANVVVAMYATNLIHACYLRIPGISILLPNAGKKRLEKTSLPDFPANGVGATIGIYEENMNLLKNELEKIMNNFGYRATLKKNQERFFPFDKKTATERVAEAIKQELTF